MRFGVAAARLGLGMNWPACASWSTWSGPSFAKEIFFTARQFSADEALAMGLINRKVPVAELRPRCATTPGASPANAPLTVASIKTIVGQLVKDQASRDDALCQQVVDRCFGSELRGRTARSWRSVRRSSRVADRHPSTSCKSVGGLPRHRQIDDRGSMAKPSAIRRPAYQGGDMKLSRTCTALAAAGFALSMVTPSALAEMAPWEAKLYEAAKKEKSFVVYTSHYNSETAADLCNAFDKKYPEVKCNVVRTTAQVAFQRLQQDMKANVPVASVFSSTDVSHYGALRKMGAIQQYKPNNFERMVDSLKEHSDPDHYSTVTAAALMLITYNTELVAEKDAPKNWPDLLDPKWKNQVSIGHPAFSGYVGTWTVLMRKLYGWEYFEKLEKNSPQIGRSVNDTVTMLNAKERSVAAGSEVTTLMSRDKGNPLAVVYPTDGALLMVSPSAVLTNAPSPNAGKLFIEFLLDTEAAQLQVAQHALSVIKGIKRGPGKLALEEIKVARPTDEEIAKGIPEVKELFRDTFGI
ncbi:MAG: extracellular solute-binding protein [Burkholderiaceae bacterium]